MAKAKKANAGNKARTKSEIYRELAEQAGVSRKQVSTIFDGLTELVKKDLTKGPKVFTVPGLMKIIVKQVPARKAHMGINRFTGQEQMFKAKPAHKTVKVRALKGLKDMVR